MLFECNKLSLIYDQGKEAQTYALRNVNLNMESNKLVGIIGPSGSGKSSLLYSLAGLKVPTLGSVKYKGVDMHEISAAEKAKIRRNEFGFIFQRNFLIEYMDVMHNVLVTINSNTESSRRKALDMLERLGIAHLQSKKPYMLSGGQRQRVSIARALINDPQVIFADELTASLDHDSAKEVMKVLQDYKKNGLVLVVTHDHTILDHADEIIHIWDGMIKSGEDMEESR
jgi:putative ABC transport system ATP-binding protein